MSSSAKQDVFPQFGEFKKANSLTFIYEAGKPLC